MSDTTTTDQGWMFPTQSSAGKAHYFRADQRSLCGKWGSFMAPREAFEPETGPSPSDCVACRRRLDKEGTK